jgi:hypothetical protein
MSANHYDMSNANLIVASKNASIPTIGFLDHWKGFDRLIDDNKDFSYCPNWLGVIDDFTVSNLSDYNLIARIESVGHPVLESLINRKAIQRKTKRIVFVSQPEVENKTYNSLFLTPYRSSTLLAVLTDSINNSSVDYQLYYRPHPKESPNELLGSSISLDTSSKNELYDKYDIFIGFDSMLLLEAQLAGASSLSIRFAEVKTVYRDEVPYPYALKIENILDFEKAIAGNTSYSQPAPTPFVNSSNRCFNFINSFIGSVSNA